MTIGWYYLQYYENTLFKRSDKRRQPNLGYTSFFTETVKKYHDCYLGACKRTYSRIDANYARTVLGSTSIDQRYQIEASGHRRIPTYEAEDLKHYTLGSRVRST